MPTPVSSASMIRLILLILGTVATITAVGVCIQTSAKATPLRADLAELQHARHGLLNPGHWSAQLSAALRTNMEQIDGDATQRQIVKDALTTVIQTVLAQLQSGEAAEDGSGGAISGFYRRMMQQMFSALRLDAESIAESVLTQLEDPETRASFDAFLESQLPTLISNENTAAAALLTPIYARNACLTRADCQGRLGAAVRAFDERLIWATMIALLSAVFTIGCALYRGSTVAPARWTTSTAAMALMTVFALLVGGIATPMIEMSAEVTNFSIALLGSSVVFEPQLLFYQNKSILQLVWLLVQTAEPHLIIVGIGVVTFSVVFPALKLGAISWHWLHWSAAMPRVVEFFGYQTSKWSMADVFVVAIFLAYLGFDGLTDNQLALIGGSGEVVDISTRNGTRLGAGFYLFTGFTLGALLVTQRLRLGPAGRRLGESLTV